MITTIGFALAAAAMLWAGLCVVRTKNLVHAVLWLGVMLAITAVLYAMLSAPFLAAVQLLLYVGGVVTLMIFGVMVTRRHDGRAIEAERGASGRGSFAAVAFFGVLAGAIMNSELPNSPSTTSTVELAALLVGPHVLAFEALSLLLLAAILGAIVIARRRDFGAPAVAARNATALSARASITPVLAPALEPAAQPVEAPR